MKNKHNLPFLGSSKWGISWQIVWRGWEGGFLCSKTEWCIGWQKRENEEKREKEMKHTSIIALMRACSDGVNELLLARLQELRCIWGNQCGENYLQSWHNSKDREGKQTNEFCFCFVLFFSPANYLSFRRFIIRGISIVWLAQKGVYTNALMFRLDFYHCLTCLGN